MSTKQQDEYLKTAFGINVAGHGAAASALAKQGAPAVPPGAEEDPPPPASPYATAPVGTPHAAAAAPPDDPPPSPAKQPDDMAMIQPQDLMKLRAGLASIEREIKDGLARQHEIEGEAKKAHVDLKKTDAVAKAGARFGAAISDGERGNFNRALGEVEKSRENIRELFERAHQAKRQLDIFRKLKLENVSDAEEDERGKQAANIFDTVVNSLKAVLDLVTGDLAQFPAAIPAQAGLEILGGDGVKDRVEESFKRIEAEQNNILDGLNNMVSQLNAFRADQITALIEELHDLARALLERFKELKGDLKAMGDQIRVIAKAHKGDAGNFAPLLSVYGKIAEAEGLLSTVEGVARSTILADKRWMGVLVPLGTRDRFPLSLGENGEALVYRNGRTTNYFIIKASSGTFADSADDGAKGLEKLADAYKSLQAARDAYGQVKPLAEQWSKALSTGMDNPAKR
ncbi:MAG TPA: hypothetical protein VLX85_13425 [Stellaceae bacterium]|nr:hypothetical protein [Stellaceae bacterium]